MDEHGVVIFANAAARGILGYEPAELIGNPLTMIMPEMMRQLHKDGFKRYLATSHKAINWRGTELTALRKNGQEFPVEISFGEMTRDGHKSFTGLIRDISEKKRTEEALRNTQGQLSRAIRTATVGEFAASIAHEINQPLAAVVANGQACLRWLAAGPSGLAKAQEAAERIVRDGKEAGEVVRRIRALFKHAPPEKVDLDLNEVIGEVLRLLSGEAVKRGVTIETDLGNDWKTVEGDRVQIQQLLFNLIQNGIEAMDAVLDRPRKLFIRSRRNDPESVLVEIQDSGAGMEDSERIFEAFYTTKESGMGMGLAICRSIIDAHHGKLWASTGNGEGTTFSFTLPAAVGAAS
jgi:PAS domain S-box-containing protein